ncbi:hypothetical protein QSH57_004219 [Fusarium oxysporum f. sp. vasinfectum]|nr:hypothetical protein QSH57_004219 [Fusarium oxysporum f. sp. vasinfectum]
MAPETSKLKFLALETPLPVSESANLLGRVVQRYDNLFLGFTPESPAKTLTQEQFARFVVVQHIDDARLTAQVSSLSSGFANVFARASASTTATGTTTVTAPRVTTRQLRSPVDYFNALKADPVVRRELLKLCPVNDTVYLVVGTMSARSASFEHTMLRGYSTSGGVMLPLGAVAGAAALAAGMPLVDPNLGGAMPDLEAEVKRERLAGGAKTFTMHPSTDDDGGQVFAVAYAVVRRTWRGLGKDVRVRTRQPEYSGGVHFGSDDSDDSEDEDGPDNETELCEADEAALAEGLELEEL